MNFNELIKTFGVRQHYEKKSHVFAQGDKSPYLYFIEDGTLKTYYNDEEGKEFIKSFIFSGEVIANSQALHGGVCNFSLLCLKDVTLIKLHYDKIRHAATNNLETANSIIDFLMTFAQKKEQREYELLCLSAEQRYEKLLTQSPKISELLTQNDIAKYLGITPVALSRIKHRKK